MAPVSRTIAGAAVGQQGAEQHLAVAGVLDGQRGGGGRDELAQRDDVALTGETLERPGDEHLGATVLRAVARLVATSRAARARLARADLAVAGRGRRAVVAGLGA